MKKYLMLLALLLVASGWMSAQTSAEHSELMPQEKQDSAWLRWSSVPAPPTPKVTGGVTPAELAQPLDKHWLTYGGDYTDQRYSLLNMVNRSNVQDLSLAWITPFTGGTGAHGGGGGRATGFFLPGRGGGSAPRTIVGGFGTGQYDTAAVNFKGVILESNGVLYASVPNNAWAVDALTGDIIWHFYWKTRGGDQIGNRGMAIWHNYVYVEEPDDYLVSLDAATGTERWAVPIASHKLTYYTSPAPVIIRNHVIVGNGINLGEPGFLESYDPVSGRRQWIHYSAPQHRGDPGLSSWPSLFAARHGGGTTWGEGAYDPETNLYIYGTGNPVPAYVPGKGEQKYTYLYTDSLIAINVDTGKMAWYYQTSPHDTHDWDSTELPVLVDGTFDGKPRKLVLQALRNGYFFVLDRTTGQHLLTAKFGQVVNWAKGLTPTGAPDSDPQQSATVPGAWVNGDVTNYPPPSFSPQTGLLYVPENDSLRLLYRIDLSAQGSMGLGGFTGGPGFNYGSYINAINYKTGRSAWRYRLASGSSGTLATAGHLVFTRDGAFLVALDAATGKALWHTKIGSGGNAPETYELNGKQYVIATAGNQLFCFVLNPPRFGVAARGTAPAK